MGRLEVQIRHGHDGGGWGAVAALIAFILLAAAGGGAHKPLSGVAHDMLTAVEVTAWTFAGLVLLAVAGGLGWLAFKVRRAVRASRPAGAPVITITPEAPRPRNVPGADHPALGAPPVSPIPDGCWHTWQPSPDRSKGGDRR